MRIFLAFAALFLTSLILQACQATSSRDSSTNIVSTVRPASEKVIYKAMGNGLMGEQFKSLSNADGRRALAAEYRALEYGSIGQAIDWKGTSSTASGAVTAGQPYKVGSQDCRQYSHNFTLGTTAQTASGSACRNEDGSWSPLL